MTDTEAGTAADSDDLTGSDTTELQFPKVKVTDEDPSIVHYSPKAHEVLDPETRVS